jgi:hypothetical protein
MMTLVADNTKMIELLGPVQMTSIRCGLKDILEEMNNGK